MGLPTCSHLLALHADGLCDQCREDYDVDPAAWLEYGDHKQGRANWERLQLEIERQMGAPAIPGVTNDELPF